MFGWEFPPIVSGGLGVACHGIVQSLLDKQIDVMLVLPFIHKNMPLQEKRLQYIQALEQRDISGEIHIKLIDTLLQPYLTPENYTNYKRNSSSRLYGKDLWTEVQRYAHQATVIAKDYSYDIIHAHEWLTALAGIEAKKISGKPFVFHVHALESDRNPHAPNPATQSIEKMGLDAADLIMAVSDYTKNRIMQEYKISAEKIVVIYNGHSGNINPPFNVPMSSNGRFIVLFLGRITEQKGPHYFIKAAEKILSVRQDIDFIVAGEGDQLPYAIETCARLGISSHVHFTGFLDRNEVSKFYQLSDVYVMPSTSEPFGLVCLEAIAHDVPVVISKQSGVSEVLTHSFKVDYWDTDQLAEKIMALLDYPAIKKEMLPHAKRELSELTWDAAANKILSNYTKLQSIDETIV